VLVELAQAGRVGVDERGKGLNGLRVHAVAGEPLPDPLLQAADEKVAERVARRPDPPHRNRHRASRERAGPTRRAGPAASGEQEDAGRVPYDGHAGRGHRHKSALVERVRAALVDGAEPDARTAAVIALLCASGTLPSPHRVIPWSGAVHQRAKGVPGHPLLPGRAAAALAGPEVVEVRAHVVAVAPLVLGFATV
jgi:hypothetical protein